MVREYYTPRRLAKRLDCSYATVLRRMRAGLFGAGVVNLGSATRPDYRIPDDGVNAHLEARRLFPGTSVNPEPETDQGGIKARTKGELRRKVRALATSP